MAADATIGYAAIAEVAIAELAASAPAVGFVPRPNVRPLQYRQGWQGYIQQNISATVRQLPIPPTKPLWEAQAYKREYVQRQPLTYLAQFANSAGQAPPAPKWMQPAAYTRAYVQAQPVTSLTSVTQEPTGIQGYLQPWTTYTREYIQRQPSVYLAPFGPVVVTPDSPATGAWVQNWPTYSREYVQRQPQYPLSIFDLGNQGNAPQPRLPLQDWRAYVRDYVQGKLRQEPGVPAPTLNPEFNRPFTTPWRVDLYPSQQTPDQFLSTVLTPPPPPPYIPPSNIRPAQYRVDWRVKVDTGAIALPAILDAVPPSNTRPLQTRTEWRVTSDKQYNVYPIVFDKVPPPNVRPLQTRLDWRLHYKTERSLGTGSSQAGNSIPPNPVRPLQTRQGWGIYYKTGEQPLPVIPQLHESIPPNPPRPLQTRQGWGLAHYNKFQIAYTLVPPTDVVVLEEPIFDFWDVPPYPRQQPKLPNPNLLVLTPRSIVYSPSGGITFSGSPVYTRGYKWTPSGGIVFGGNASYTTTSTGVVVPTYIYNRRFYTKLDGKR